jgi:hypothetical protein
MILKIYSFKTNTKLFCRDKNIQEMTVYNSINISNINNQNLLKSGCDERYEKESNEDILKISKHFTNMELLIILQSCISSKDKIDILNYNQEGYHIFNIRSGGLMDSWDFEEF